MKLHEIIGEFVDAAVGEATTGVGSGLPDNWKNRAEAFRREQERRRNLAQKIRDAEANKYRQQRVAQDHQFQANDRIRNLKRQQAIKPET